MQGMKHWLDSRDRTPKGDVDFGQSCIMGDMTYRLDHSTSSRVMGRPSVYSERAEAVLSMFRRLHIYLKEDRSR